MMLDVNVQDLIWGIWTGNYILFLVSSTRSFLSVSLQPELVNKSEPTWFDRSRRPNGTDGCQAVGQEINFLG